jgi:hypothetical protein
MHLEMLSLLSGVSLTIELLARVAELALRSKVVAVLLRTVCLRPLATTIQGVCRVMTWAFGLDGLVPLELALRHTLAIMTMVSGCFVCEKSKKKFSLVFFF